MSVISSRPQVRSVSSAAIGAAAAGLVVVSARLVAEMLREQGQVRLAATLPVSRVTDTMTVARPIAAVRAARARRQISLASPHMSPVERIKQEAIGTLTAAPVFSAPDRLREPLTALANANTAVEATLAANRLVQTVTVGHQAAVMQAAAFACSRASVDVGFTTIQSEVGVTGELRVIGTNDMGQVIVSEVKQDADGEVSIESEMIGVTDGSCHAAMSHFDAAVERHGLYADKPNRKFTGGVCETAFARAFVKRPRPDKTEATVPPRAGRPDGRRTQRLNPRKRQVQN